MGQLPRCSTMSAAITDPGGGPGRRRTRALGGARADRVVPDVVFVDPGSADLTDLLAGTDATVLTKDAWIDQVEDETRANNELGLWVLAVRTGGARAPWRDSHESGAVAPGDRWLAMGPRDAFERLGQRTTRLPAS